MSYFRNHDPEKKPLLHLKGKKQLLISANLVDAFELDHHLM